MENYRMPNGSYTKNVIEYSNAWEKLGKDLSEALDGNWKMYAYYPGLAMGEVDKSGKFSHRSREFDVDIAERIIELYKKSLKGK